MYKCDRLINKRVLWCNGEKRGIKGLIFLNTFTKVMSTHTIYVMFMVMSL